MRSFILGLLLMATNVTSAHPFHASVCDMTYDSDDKYLKISVRLFLDDLELALHSFSETNDWDITNTSRWSKTEKLVGEYLLKNLNLKSKGKSIDLNYLGSEMEADVMWVYLQSEKLKSPKSLSVSHTSLFEVFENQENLINIRVDEKKKGIRLHTKKREEVVEL